jgi:hypothetical protein
MQLPLLAMALMRLMVVPIMGEWASIVEPTMVVQHIGMVVPATPMARGAARPRGVAAPEARLDGEAGRSPGAAVVFTVADSGDDGRTAAA